ncbi:MAG: hypothetical protein HKN43_09420 [Rhodothermales bacterium]|nr:hypothetical protein [Rhodothermales bacterium]
MTPEEFQRIKEAEKEHLRSLKKLKQAVRDLERQKKLTGAVDNITRTENLLDENDALVDNLAMETAHNEAKLEVALESAAAQESIRRAEEARTKLDEDLKKIRAQDLVRQLKNQMGETDTPTTPVERNVDSTAETSEAVSDAEPESETATDEDLPEKTLGRMRRK